MRIVTNACGRGRATAAARRILLFRICGFCVDFSSCDVQSFQSVRPFCSIAIMFFTTWLFHNSEPKILKNPEKSFFKSSNVRLCPNEYRRHRGRGRQRRRSFLYDWIVSRAMGALFKTESDYFLGVICDRGYFQQVIEDPSLIDDYVFHQ